MRKGTTITKTVEIVDYLLNIGIDFEYEDLVEFINNSLILNGTYQGKFEHDYNCKIIHSGSLTSGTTIKIRIERVLFI